MTHLSDAELRQTLAAADPASAVSLERTVATRVIHRARPVGRRRRRRPAWLIALIAAFTIAVPAAAVAGGIGARTGIFGSPVPGDNSDTTGFDYDDSEWLDLGASDLKQVVASMYPDWLPLAPGITPDAMIDRATAEMTQSGAMGQETVVKRTYEFIAYQDWINAWITAHASGDASTLAQATQVLLEAPTWPTIVATDDGGFVLMMRACGERIAQGDAEAAQALAQISLASEWDGVDRNDLLEEIYHDAAGEQG
jgi:hypothetical protein